MTNEKALIKQLQDHSTREKAFETLIKEFQEQLYWQIRSMVLNHEDSDDILQNTFIKAWQGLESFRGDSSLSTWLRRIAYNETINQIKRRKGHTISLNDIEGNSPMETKLQLESDPYFDGEETAMHLHQAIQCLPAKQRQVFNMKYFEEMKYEEISKILNTSVGALKASYHHAVQKISDYFKRLE